MRPTRPLANLALAAASVVLALGLAEFVLRVAVPPTRGYFVITPGTDWTVAPASDVLPGVRGLSHFQVNRFGVRGRPFGADGLEYRMLAVGGSTTRCVLLDDSEAWTYLLEHELDRTADGRAVWVGNVGRDATTTRDHVVQLKYLLPQYPRMDAIVALVGVNDMMGALAEGWAYRLPEPVTEPAAERRQLPHAFAELPGRLRDRARTGATPAPWYKATALWQLGRRAKQVLESRRTFSLPGLRAELERARLDRQTAAAWVDSLPPLDNPLVEYRRNLNAMADLASRAGARLVFVTQPSLWRAGISEADERLLVFGQLRTVGTAARTYYTTRALARAMAWYNDALLAVCRARGLDCVDAAAAIPRDTTAMYDDVHFNEQGSRRLARVLADYFRARPPFQQPN